MPIQISNWFSPKSNPCPICGRSSVRAVSHAPIPLRHPAPRRILSALCQSCLELIPWIAAPICRVCGRPETCGDCSRRPIRHYNLSRCAVRYDSQMKDWLALYKYRGHEKLEPILAAMLAFALERLSHELGTTTAKPSFHTVASVPLAPERLQERGFNQAERMALQLSRWYGLSYRPLLLRLRHTEKQSLKDRQSRVKDMMGNFSASSIVNSSANMLGLGSPHRIILVDDIYTTGSTLNECSRVLRNAFGVDSLPEVYGVLWARS